MAFTYNLGGGGREGEGEEFGTQGIDSLVSTPVSYFPSSIKCNGTGSVRLEPHE